MKKSTVINLFILVTLVFCHKVYSCKMSALAGSTSSIVALTDYLKNQETLIDYSIKKIEMSEYATVTLERYQHKDCILKFNLTRYPNCEVTVTPIGDIDCQ